MRRGKGLLWAALFVLLVAPVSAQEQFRFVNGGTVTAFGYYVGPYNGATGAGFTQSVILNCVDFFHEINYGQVWTANVTGLGEGTNLTNTRFGGMTNALTLYRQAAWLTTQYAGASNYNIGQIQATIWSLFGAAPPLAPAANAAWLAGAQANYQNIRFEDFAVVTDINKNLASSAQEFLIFRPTVTPEPITMMLLGTGLVGIGAARRRQRKNSETPEGDKTV